MDHPFFYISWPLLHNYDMNLPNFTFCWGRERQHNNVPFLLLNFHTVLYNSTLEKYANIWRIVQDGISAKKFEAARIHFLNDVFVAVADVVA